ncbi:MDIS1-interacting receptor like kinase 2-like [Quercus suber]|uniref:MDIS1-interacting receptor like kinase 2-like n=1 Tax=Quercus suber TaxID=58331 RepID=UPI0032DF0FA8
MAFKVLFCSLVLLLVSLLHFATFASSTTSSVTATAEVGKAFKEAEALLNWKASLDNQNKSLLSSWVGDRPCINWVEITCDDLELGVTRLNLSSFGLKGLLKHMWVLQLLNNSLTGPIPTTIGNLTKLTSLDLSQNELSGSIPASIGQLAALSILLLNDNKLSGSIPTTIGNVTKLTSLTLHLNELSGSIPTTIGNMIKLTGLALPSTELSGSIPTTIGNMTKLTYYALDRTFWINSNHYWKHDQAYLFIFSY